MLTCWNEITMHKSVQKQTNQSKKKWACHSVLDRIFFKWPEKGQLGKNVWKYRLVNTVAISCNTLMRKTTEMFQRKKAVAGDIRRHKKSF